MAALWPTLRARKNPQVWYTGSAVDQEVHNEGLPWTRVRERALKGEPELTYFEWSLNYEDPRGRSRRGVSGRELVLGVEPRVRNQDLQGALRVGGSALWTGAPSRWNCSASATTPILRGQTSGSSPTSSGRTCEQGDSELRDPVFIAFDVSPERRTSIAAAGQNQDGNWHVEIFEKLAGTNWLPRKLEEIVAAHEPEMIVCDGLGPGKSLVGTLDEARDLGRDLRLRPARRSLREIRGRGERGNPAPSRNARIC